MNRAQPANSPLHPERYYGDDATPRLRLEADVQRLADGWCIRLPVRKEDISVEKRTVVVEEVEVRREYAEEVERVDGTVRREELTVERDGEVRTEHRGPSSKRTSTKKSRG